MLRNFLYPLQIYIGLRNLAVLETDHASAQRLLVRNSLKGSTQFHLVYSSHCQYHCLCGYVVDHNEKPIQAKNNTFFFPWEQLSLDQFPNLVHPVAKQINTPGMTEQSMRRGRTRDAYSSLPLNKAFIKM